MNDIVHDVQPQEHKIEIPLPTPQHVENIIEKQDETVPHVIMHEGRITHLEEQAAAHYSELLAQIQTTKDELFTAVQHSQSEQAAQLDERLKHLEQIALRMESTIVEAPQQVVDDLNQAPTDAVEIVPEVEKIVRPAEPKGIRERRRAKHKGK